MAFRTTSFASVILLALGSSAHAQIRASERGTVSQTVDGTVITVDYSRPRVLGRENIFGRVVREGEMWTPGANWATTIQFSRDVRLNGHEVAAGTYSVWMVTGLSEWTVHLHKPSRLFHTKPPKPDKTFLSFSISPDQGELVEVLTFDFPRVARDGTTLRMRWETAIVSLDVLVKPTMQASSVMTDQEIAPYLGSYSVIMYDESRAMPEQKIELINANGALRGIIDGPHPVVLQFLPAGQPHRFLPAFVKDGELLDVETETPVLFEIQGGRAVGFRVAGIGDDTWMRGKRTK